MLGFNLYEADNKFKILTVHIFPVFIINEHNCKLNNLFCTTGRKEYCVKRFIKQIDYAKDQIAVTLYYINNFGNDFISETLLKTSPLFPLF
jgi:hypothetical protein